MCKLVKCASVVIMLSIKRYNACC